MYSFSSFKKQIKSLSSLSTFNAQHPPIDLVEGSLLFNKEIPIQFISFSGDFESEVSGFEYGLIGKAQGWTKTPTRWILLSEWIVNGNKLRVNLIYGLDSWKTLN
ncbi:MAG: hypothetical protein HeimC3_09740 [Candidatus Heimdallarchaeota archaeon LC_3]|nr:MAG: hypothetical protein HeimC3_09740 [Candidatus Heimdallarchaeota archaeon LC_3]